MKKETDEDFFGAYAMIFLLLLIFGLFSFIYLLNSTYNVYTDVSAGTTTYGKTTYQLKPDAYDWSNLLLTLIIVTEVIFLLFSTNPRKKKNKIWHTAKEMMVSMTFGFPISLIINGVVFYFLRNIKDIVNGLLNSLGCLTLFIGTATILIIVFIGWAYFNSLLAGYLDRIEDTKNAKAKR
jgi:ABC-type sulfate transport system permease subunit